jgi:hypothetical protein
MKEGPTNPSETALISGVLDREQRAWREFVRRFNSSLREVVRERLATEGAVDEAQVDDTLGDFWEWLIDGDMRRLRSYDPGHGLPLLSWLAVRASRVVDAHLRRRRREPTLLPLREIADVADPRGGLVESTFLTTAEAARYCGYQTTGALRKAAMMGRIKPAGRRGGTGTLMWRRSDLDHYLSSGPTSIVPGGLAGTASAHEGGTHEQVDHALGKRFGKIFVDALRKQDVEEWLAEMGRKVQAKKLSPNTVNSWLSILRVIVNAAVAEFDLPRNPIALVEDLDTSTWHTYTDEQPNSLTAAEVPVFLAKLRGLYPQHFAFVALGFATGLRPSSLRPFRRRGDKADVLWDQGVLLVRRSQTGNEEPMETTKTGKLQRISFGRLQTAPRPRIAPEPEPPDSARAHA